LTNLQGRVYLDVQLVRGDLDGLVYLVPGKAEGGRISYTNIDSQALGALGFTTNRNTFTGMAQLRAELAALRNDQQRSETFQLQIRYELGKLIAQVESTAVLKGGNVIQKTGDNVLANDGGDRPMYFYVSDCPDNWVEGRAFSGSTSLLYPIGNYEYTTVSGARSTVRHYTCSLNEAVKLQPKYELLIRSAVASK